MRNDEDIKTDIVDELYWDTRIDASKVAVTVDDGVVTLSGEVPTYWDRSTARMAAWAIADVIDVFDDMTVSYVAPPPLPSDSEIRTRAIDMLTWDPAIDESDITVSVIGGVITLEGTVNAHWKRSFVENKMGGIRGVISVENKLAVVPTKTIRDELIAENVVAALDRDIQVDARDVEVEVDDGIVKLSGNVPRWAARLAAGDDASRTGGVINVVNELKVAA
ncbi:MAG: BON domain-containing protein [Halochromatium sp.]|uniref:BON domain-containing protein n=1 Tax=Halochromatium sp. TaxID=2049430 RepID=UPI00397B1AC9